MAPVPPLQGGRTAPIYGTVIKIICRECASEADLRQSLRLDETPLPSTIGGVTLLRFNTLPATMGNRPRGHAACKGGTHCDCQHKIRDGKTSPPQ